MAAADFQATADAQIRVHDSETGGSAGGLVDVVLLPDKSRVERGVDPDRRWHLEGPSTGGGDSDTLFGGLGGDFAAGARSRVTFGTRFVLYQRNIENLCQDRAALREEIRKSVAELYDAALEFRATIAIKGAPEQHAEGANVPGMRTASARPIGITPFTWRAPLAADNMDTRARGALPGAGSVRARRRPDQHLLRAIPSGRRFTGAPGFAARAPGADCCCRSVADHRLTANRAAAMTAPARIRGPLTYASAPFEAVNCSLFDFIRVDHHRTPGSRTTTPRGSGPIPARASRWSTPSSGIAPTAGTAQVTWIRRGRHGIAGTAPDTA